MCLSSIALAEVKHARAGNVDLAYVETGRGAAVVFVHGGLQGLSDVEFPSACLCSPLSGHCLHAEAITFPMRRASMELRTGLPI
jgi:hypothetical protein